jgi:hypothetical protein
MTNTWELVPDWVILTETTLGVPQWFPFCTTLPILMKAAVTELAELQASSLIGIGSIMGPGDRIITMGRMRTDCGK